MNDGEFIVGELRLTSASLLCWDTASTPVEEYDVVQTGTYFVILSTPLYHGHRLDFFNILVGGGIKVTRTKHLNRASVTR